MQRAGLSKGYCFMRLLAPASLALALLAAPPAIADLIPGSEFTSGNWSGGAYSYDDGSGRWSHCVISAYYPGHAAGLMFSLSDGYVMMMGVATDTPRFHGVDNFPVVLRVDRHAPISAEAIVMPGEQLATLQFEDLDSALDLMRRGRMLEIDSQFGTSSFSLEGTYRALEAAYDCAARYAGAGAPVPAVTTQAVTTQAAGWSPTPEQTALMYQIATKIIADAGQSDFAYLTPRDLDDLGYANLTGGVLWRAMGGAFLGGVFVGRKLGEGIDIVADNASDLAVLTVRCPGDLATVSRNYDVDGFPASEVVGLCTTAKGTVETTMTKMDIDGVLVETLGVYTTRAGQGAEAGKPAPEGGRVSGETAAFTAASFVTKAAE
jgi:hypothetical protein